ncbi:MAG: hypothetical protein R2729_15170 [Bryobacteraceae bacterium]
MGASPLPPSLDQMGDRRFSFYPPIVNVEHNEWIYVQGNWSEVLVENTKTKEQIWIPRTFMGDVSRVEEPVMIVGLKRELEYKGGSVWPHARKVLAMPANPTVKPGPSEKEPPAPRASEHLRLDSSAESRIGRMILIALAAAIVLTMVVVGVTRKRGSGESVEFRGVMQAELGLTGKSDYFDVVRKLGEPGQDRWKDDTGERQYRAMTYPKHGGVTIILMGPDRAQMRYIGAKDPEWRTIHSVELPGGRNTDSILRTLPRF